MPEAAAWQFKEVKRVPDRRAHDGPVVLKGRLFAGEIDGVIDDGFVRIEDGKIAAVGRRCRARSERTGRRVRRRRRQDDHAGTVQQPRASRLGRRERPRVAGARGHARDLRLQVRGQHGALAERRRHDGARPRNEQDEPRSRSRRSRRASSAGRSCSSAARRSCRPAATRTGAAARLQVPTRCGRLCASRSAAVQT